MATSPTLAEIGEGGEPEAVMPLSKLAALLDEYTKKPKPTGGTDGQEGGGEETIVFSPVLNFYGKADREEVEEATRISFEEFKRLYKRLKAEERRKKFKPEPAMGVRRAPWKRPIRRNRATPGTPSRSGCTAT